MDNGSTGAPNRATRERQAALIFDEIANLASCVERMGILLVANGEEDERDIAAYQTAIKTISAVVGLLGDMGSNLCGGFAQRGVEPEKWLLSPVYHLVAAVGEKQ